MKCILAGIDFSDVSTKVAQQAVACARAFAVPLRLLHVAVYYQSIAPPEIALPVAPGPMPLDVLRTAEKELHAFAEKIKNDYSKIEPVVAGGLAAAQILKQASEAEAGMVVLGSHGHGALYHLLMGSVTASVVRKAPCAVVIVRSEQPAAPQVG